MKKTIPLTAVFVISTLLAFSQAGETKNPFSKLGYKKQVMYTSSKGEFDEFHSNADVVEIGSVYFNTKTNEVVGLVDPEKEKVEVASATSAMSVDPLCEKYYWISPYAYCLNNPVKFVDPDGRDGMVTGTGTKDDPYVVTANYYYQNGSLNKDQVAGLNSAVDTYNKSGGKNGVEVKNADGSTSYVKYNLSAQGVDDVKEARAGTAFETTSGETQYYGNIVDTKPSGSGVDFGNADNFEVNFNVGKINEGVAGGMNSYSLNKGVAIHEIGHNLGGEHRDGTSVMDIIQGTTTTSQIGGITTTSYSYPSMSNKFTKIIFNRRDTPRSGPTVVNGVTYLSGEGRLWTRK